MRKRVSSMDVARLAEVSQATVSYVLRNRTDKVISEITRAKVLSAARQLQYMPNRLADGILRGKTMTIGVLMPDFAHSFNSSVLKGLESGLAEGGYRILIAHNRNDSNFEKEQVRMLMEYRVEGIVAVTDEETVLEMPAWVEETTKLGVVVCVIDDLILEGVVDTVISDDLAGATMAVEHLIAQGHKSIAFLGGGDRTTTSRDRYAGYEAALGKHGLEPFRLESGQKYRTDVDPDLEPLFSPTHGATALFSASDGLLSQAMTRLENEGRHRASELAYVGYGNLEISRYLSLTTVEQHPEEMGRRAAARMIARLEGETGQAVTERVTPDLIVRKSSTKR